MVFVLFPRFASISWPFFAPESNPFESRRTRKSPAVPARPERYKYAVLCSAVGNQKESTINQMECDVFMVKTFHSGDKAWTTLPGPDTSKKVCPTFLERFYFFSK